MNRASQEEIEIQRADKEASQALLATIQAQRDALLAAAKIALPYLKDKAEVYPGGSAAVSAAALRQAILLAESE